jgi:hypothetical protein
MYLTRLLSLAICLAGFVTLSASDQLLIEAESFKDTGGWVVDTQFIEIMGSPYLLAHGLGEPVRDAVTKAVFPSPGVYRVFIRTKDWVAPWKAPGAPGRFQILVNGTPLKETFGDRSGDWFWQDGGAVEITGVDATVALHDLTGFEGRCDAIYFTKDAAISPPNGGQAMAIWRLKLLGLPEKPIETGQFDLVVAGGGYAGMSAAISAARMGCKVALIQDRPVLGGNGSSEIRVWPQGLTRRGLYPHLGEIVEELADNPKSSPGATVEFNDAQKEAIVRSEKNIALFLNHHVTGVEMEGKSLSALLAFDVRTGIRRRFAGKYFTDCTGHGSIGVMAGADHVVKLDGHMGMSNMWRWRMADTPHPFPATPWALDLSMADFPYPKRGAGEWFWETGFDKHPIEDLESMRDWNFRAVYGAFNAMKNKDPKNAHANAELEWVAYVGGTRESRQLLGDVILTRDDIAEKRSFPDGCVPTTWDIDLHYPEAQYTNKFPENPFISKAVFEKKVDRQNWYPVPYRCFYSRNIDNLFMAGRDISVTHEALGTVRVMKTGGMMGEVAGKAASICVEHGCTPRQVYERHWEEMKRLMNLPGAVRRESIREMPAP